REREGPPRSSRCFNSIIISTSGEQHGYEEEGIEEKGRGEEERVDEKARRQGARREAQAPRLRRAVHQGRADGWRERRRQYRRAREGRVPEDQADPRLCPLDREADRQREAGRG